MKKVTLLFLVIILSLCSCTQKKTPVDNEYKNDALWAYKEIEKNKNVDTFFIAPTATSGDDEHLYLDYENEKHLSKFKGTIDMEKGIYEENTRLFAPYYHQALLNVYEMPKEKLNECLDNAYIDIKASFDYYLDNLNNGNKIILAGFSQGADMCLRLLNDYVSNNDFYDKYIACYALGWIVDDNYLLKNDRLKFAEGEIDQKVIISFDCEDPEVEESFIVGKTTKTHSINPLTWKTDYTEAPATLNKGAVFLNTRGVVTGTIDNFCGCYIDNTRGVLKVTGVDKETYSLKGLALMPEGIYHTYDYQFFYNNLKENVNKRIEI